METSSRKLAADYASVASQTSSRKLAADVDHETIVPSVFESVSRRKKDRDLNVVQTLKDIQNLHVRGETLAQQRLFEAEADVDVKHWEKRNSDIVLYEVNQEFEPPRLQLQQANQCADQAQREKIRLCGELEMRNRLFNESRAKDCQENEELRRIWFEETDVSDYDMIASAWKKLLNTHIQFRKRVSVEEQCAQTHDRFLRGRQNCSHDLRALPCNRSS